MRQAFIAFLLCPLLATGSVSAQEAGVDRTAAARALFEEGLMLLDEEQWEEAADRFQRALALRPSPQITYNLTTALVPLGHLVRATELLRQVSRDPTASPDVRDAAEARRQQVLPRLAGLTVTVGSDLSGAELFIDERPLDSVLVGVSFPVDPGHHIISARERDRTVASQGIDLSESERGQLHLEQGMEADEEPTTVSEPEIEEGSPVPERRDEERESRSIVRRWWFWTIIGTVVVAGGVTAGVLVGRSAGEPTPLPGLTETIILGDDQ